MLFLTFTLLLVATIQDPTRFFFQHAGGVMARFWPVYLLLTVLLPLTVVDAVQVSNRIAGPIFRLRRHLHEVAEGKTVSELKFRDDDFWIELAPDVDAAFDKIREQEKAKLKEDLVEA